MGTLVTLDLPDDSPVLELPWIITFGPMDEDAEDWEPVVCGPYERAHALALAETVIAEDEDLMAVVEPVQPYSSVEEIQEEIASAKLSAEDEYELDDDDLESDDDVEVSMDAEFDEHAGHDHDGHHHHDGHDHFHDDEIELEEVEPTAPPSPAEVRAGFARIAARLNTVA